MLNITPEISYGLNLCPLTLTDQANLMVAMYTVLAYLLKITKMHGLHFSFTN